ncbi:MAG: sigma-70 family RNA polymerase sigma factor [Planctomyces sp.]|jgi:RNA polymerase primary sigma factor
MSVCSARRRESKAKTSSSKRRSVVDPAELQALRTAAEELLQTEIRFIYAAEFEELEGESEPVTAALLLLEELQVSAAEVSKTVSESSADPGSGLNACDPLLTFSQEQTLFRAMNLLRYRANRMRSRLDPSAPSAELIPQIRRMLEQSEQIRGQLVRSNLRLVASIARKFSTSVQDVEEFSSDGSMILLGAIDRFDYSRRFRFSTYATHSIQRHFFRAWKVRQRRRQRFPVTSAEILTEVPEEYNEQPICADPQAVVKELLQQAPDVLDPREHQILLHRFGLGGVSSEARTLREIAADLGVSKERVRQLQLKALEKLRPFLNPAQFNLEAAGV